MLITFMVQRLLLIRNNTVVKSQRSVKSQSSGLFGKKVDLVAEKLFSE